MDPKATRRGFLKGSAAAFAGSAGLLSPRKGSAEPFGLPLGLQLYSVRDQLKTDFAGTLAAVGRLGYREVEAAGYYDRSAADFGAAMTAAGLRCVSTHAPYAALGPHFPDLLDYAKQLGCGYLICSSPGHKAPGGSGKLTLEDWRWNAGEFNRMGEVAARAGIHFGYHNHIAEFTALDGVTPYEELMRLTDPAKVTLELDCGWAVVGGANPVDLMRKHPGRISMLHVKDFKNTSPGEGEHPAAELGHGLIDYGPIFAEAKRSQSIRHYFVEQEQFDGPWEDALRVDADYLRRFN